MERMELRVLASDSLISEDEGLIVQGLVNETESWSHILGTHKRFRERIAKGTFASALLRANRVDLLAEHKTDLLLATTENDSLELWEDEVGLKMKARIAPTSYGKDYYTLMSEKLITHMSFGFKVIKDFWSKGVDGIYERVITELQLNEVSIVRNPAYPSNEITARSINADDIIPEDVVEEIPETIEEKTESVIGEEQKEVIEDVTVNNNEIVEETDEIVTEVAETEEPTTEETAEEETKEEKISDKDQIIDLLKKVREIQKLKQEGITDEEIN